MSSERKQDQTEGAGKPFSEKLLGSKETKWHVGNTTFEADERELVKQNKAWLSFT